MIALKNVFRVGISRHNGEWFEIMRFDVECTIMDKSILLRNFALISDDDKSTNYGLRFDDDNIWIDLELIAQIKKLAVSYIVKDIQ